MKPLLPFLLLAGLYLQASGNSGYVNFIRQHQQDSKVVWDMPVAPEGDAPSALALQTGGALFQLWTISQQANQDFLLDQKLVGAYLPKSDIIITTIDPDGPIPRTRVDQPFTVEINVSGLLNGEGFPQSASTVLLERHLGSYQEAQTALSPAEITSGNPFSRAYLGANGKTRLRFSASALTAEDPTKAAGEEHFVVHALAETGTTQTQIASAALQVWPVASGAIKGIENGARLRFEMPTVELLLKELYPRSNTYLMIYEGTQVAGIDGTMVKAYPIDQDTPDSNVLTINELDSKISRDGTYTLALFSDTVYGRELLCDTITFHVDRTLHVNAMQVAFSDGKEP